MKRFALVVLLALFESLALAQTKVASIEGNKLTVNFDKAGEKKVIDSFVEKA